MGRKIIGVVVGALVASAVVFAVELGINAISPPPSGFDWKNPESVRERFATMPVAALAIVPLGWFLGTAVGAWVATAIGGRVSPVPAYVVGGLYLVACVVNLIMQPHPGWMWPLGLAAAPLGTMIGLALGRQPRKAM